MTPDRLDRDVVERRLRSMRDAIDGLRPLVGMTADALAADRIRRAGAERLLQVVVDLAVDVNSHIASAVLGRAPATAFESFGLAADADAIPRALADRLAPSTGLRNVLVHQYVDIDVGIVAASIPQVVNGYDEYVVAVSSSTLPSGGGED